MCRTKKSGGPQDWVIWSQDYREKNALEDMCQPWTSRPEIELRGLSRQSDPVSFLSELIDLRWVKFCKASKLNVWGPAPEGLCTDTRHRLRNQDSLGGVHLLTTSVPYHYHSDRCFVPREHFAQLGYNFRDIKTTTLRKAIEGWPEDPKKRKKAAKVAATASHTEDIEAPQLPKRRKRKPPENRRSSVNSLLADLAGNGMCCQDVTLMKYTGEPSIISDLWREDPPSLAKLLEILKADTDESDARPLVLDPTLSAATLKNTFGDHYASEDDSDFDDDGDGDG